MYESTVGSNPTPSEATELSMAWYSSQTLFSLYMKDVQWKGAYILFSFCFCFALCMCCSETLLSVLAGPLWYAVQDQPSFMIIEITETLVTSLWVAVYVSCVCTIPYCVYCVHLFVRPCLFHKEAILLVCMSVVSTCLLVLSSILAYNVVLPFFWLFFLSFVSFETKEAREVLTDSFFTSVEFVPSLGPYVFFTLSVLAWLHVVCQLPCVALVISATVQSPLHHMGAWRKRMHVFFVVVSALICPPDVLYQCVCWCVLSLCTESVFFFLGLAHVYTHGYNQDLTQ
jgi:sec-independent protein translocase protein TatC